MSGRSPRLLERTAELAALAAACDAAGQERGSLALIEGEGGIGKTSLLAQTAELAAARGLTVLRAAGHDLERDFAFGVVLQLLEGPLRRATDDERQVLLSGAAALAAPLLQGESIGDPGSLQHGLFWLLCGMAERGPLALLVDDAHLADVGSLRLLTYLSSRLGDVGILVVVAHRPPADDEAGELLRHLRARRGAQRLAPAPLSPGGVGLLVADAGMAGAAPGFVAACAESTRGNPLYVQELLAVVTRRAIPPTDAGGDAVRRLGPVAVAEAVFLSLSRHDPSATALVRALAVLGEGARPADVARLASLPVAQTVELAASLARDGLLDGGERLTFVHPVVAAAVADDLQPLELAHAHGLAAAIRRDAGDDDGVVAAHLLKAAPLGEAWAAAVLQRAATGATALGEHATSARLLRRALDEPGDHAGTLALLAGAEAAAGGPEAAARYEQALAAAEPGEARAALRLRLGRHLIQRGRFGDAAATFAAGQEDLAGAPGALADELRASWAGAALWDAQQGPEAYEAVVATIGELTDPQTPGERAALANLGRALLVRAQDHGRALTLARRAWGDGALLEALGPEDFTLYAVTAVLIAADAPAEAAAAYHAIRGAARERGLLLPAATASYGVATCHLRVGALADAAAEAALALQAEPHGWALFAAGSRWVSVLALLGQGRQAEAEAIMELDPQRVASMRTAIDGRALDLATAELALARGDGPAAVASLDGLAEVERAVGVLIGQFNWRPPMVRALLLTGDRERALAVADESVALCRSWGAPTLLGGALHHRALAAQDADERLALLREATALLATTPAALDHAAAAAALGTELRARGEREQARGPLRLALDLAADCGAAPLAATARAELVAAGGRPRRARSTGVEALTPGELQVARLAAAGSTNREIAEMLFVTAKAVRWHLGNVYRKLGVATREELPEALGPRQPPADR
jgi:DNA-binding CsgD family transcriptional regulator